MRANPFSYFQLWIDDPALAARKHRAGPRRICVRDIKQQIKSVDEPNPTRNVQKIRGRICEGTHTGNRVRVLLDPRDKFFVRLYLRTWVMLSCYPTPAKKERPDDHQLRCGRVIVPKAPYQLCRRGVMSCRVGGQTLSIRP
jgi:hypothetical protein